MNGNQKHITILVALALVFGLLDYYRPKPIDWRITLSNQDKIPFGTFATYKLLSDVFPKQKIVSSRLPIYNQLTETGDFTGNYVFISPRFNPDKNDVNELLRFVSNGNNVFIACSTMFGLFMDSIGVEMSETLDKGQHYQTGLMADRDHKKYTFKSEDRYLIYFDSLDDNKTMVLGRQPSGKPDFVRIKFGRGNVYLNTNVMAFTNYFVLDKTRGDYAFKCLSYLPVKPIIWDEFTKQGRIGEDDVFRVLMQHEPLKWGYYIMILGVLTFIVFESKRRQRIIPIIQPLPNNTLEFTKVVGSLYFNKADHHDAALKKINYLLEYIRTHFFEPTNNIDDEFIARLTNKSGWDADKMKQLMGMIKWIKSRPEDAR